MKKRIIQSAIEIYIVVLTLLSFTFMVNSFLKEINIESLNSVAIIMLLLFILFIKNIFIGEKNDFSIKIFDYTNHKLVFSYSFFIISFDILFYLFSNMFRI